MNDSRYAVLLSTSAEIQLLNIDISASRANGASAEIIGVFTMPPGTITFTVTPVVRSCRDTAVLDKVCVRELTLILALFYGSRPGPAERWPRRCSSRRRRTS